MLPLSQDLVSLFIVYGLTSFVCGNILEDLPRSSDEPLSYLFPVLHLCNYCA